MNNSDGKLALKMIRGITNKIPFQDSGVYLRVAGILAAMSAACFVFARMM